MSHYNSNCILANVTADEMAQFAPHLRLQSLRKNQVLFKRGEAISHIHFPVGAIVSMSMQLAKWLLNMHDNNDGGVLDFSHQEIAHLLGFRREGVTVALGLLEAAQLISMKSKQIALLNHRALEDVACECYHEMRKHDPCALH